MVNDVNKFIMPNGDEIKIDGLYGKITNCLLEVPQRIKLELNNGTLTLKAGSQVIVPNGFESDGVTPKFDYVDIVSDVVATTPYINEPIFIYYRNNGIEQAANNAQCSGTSSTVDYGYWYDTTNNLINRVNLGEVTHSGVSFPLAIINASNGSWASINQTFNGMGYIGSTVWVDKGVKGLIPNGRNEDGTLRNIEFTTDKVSTLTPTISLSYGSIPVMLSSNNQVNYNGLYKYDEKNNLIYDGVRLVKGVVVGHVSLSNSVVTSFNPKQPVRVVDTSSLTECVVIIDSYVNGTSGYRIWSDGYCEQWGRTGNKTSIAITLTKKMSDANYSIQITVLNSNGDQNWAATNITVNGFTILDSENKEHSWKVSGYLAEGEY